MSDSGQPGTQAGPSFWDNPNVQNAAADLLRAVPGILGAKHSADVTATVQAQSRLLWWAGGIIVAVGIAAVGLAVMDRISGEAVTFLFGTIVGSSFSILEKFWPHQTD